MYVTVPVVKATWGNTTSHIEYYSEVEDTDIPTVDLGVPNTERGKSLSVVKVTGGIQQHT